MINAIFASTLPTIALIILFLTVLNQYKEEPWFHGMSTAVVPVVAVMLATMTWSFIKRSTSSFLGWGWTLAFVAASIVVLHFLTIHPAIIIAVVLIGALVKKDTPDKAKEKQS